MWKNIRYFSVAVDNLEEGIKVYKDLFGLKQMSPVNETQWGFRATMLGDGKKALLELVQPTNPNSALARHMKERSRPQNPRGEGVYIIGIEVDDLETTIKQVREHGGRVTQEPESPDTAWVHPLSAKYALLELQRSKE